ncbi:Kdo hydroxylase family protein [Legionella sp. CNM-4043-24]|uniref:Kdo hydroxylase family protein n=1 Tax=Legionella sp. CNM-4043-24 TaxID=3421646 RepID=UPI00403B2634
MTDPLYSLTCDSLERLDAQEKQAALTALESGQVVFFPALSFALPETDTDKFLSESILDGRHKNISYDSRRQKLGGLNQTLVKTDFAVHLQSFMQAYAQYARQMVDELFPQYQPELIWGRTSYRPAEIRGRPSSKRKDDTRVHVDSFAASPVQGLRILRVFCNVNPYGEPRVWDLGEPFQDVARRFAGDIPRYSPVMARLLHKIRVTKSLRSAYDHYQLHLHDGMKLDEQYQATVDKKRVDFPAQSTWLVFTDHVSHAALGGQYLLEQTFYLPVNAMQEPDLSPLRFWEREKGIQPPSPWLR